MERDGTVPAAWPDLHTHTSASDGALAPAELARRAGASGVDLLAVTDHDSLEGLREAREACQRSGIAFIPGVELGCCREREVHILGYFVKEDMPALKSLVRRRREDRLHRGRRFVKKLRELGKPLGGSWEERLTGEGFNRPLLARALVEEGHVRSIREAFDTLIGVGRPAYVAPLYISAREAVGSLAKEGAVPVLAHPGLLREPPEESGELDALVDAGLMGIEAFHPAHDYVTCLRYEALARSRGLLVTGGSDFHGDPHPSGVEAGSHGTLGQMNPWWTSRTEDTDRLHGRAQALLI